jgi:hypothetical protein
MKTKKYSDWKIDIGTVESISPKIEFLDIHGEPSKYEPKITSIDTVKTNSKIMVIDIDKLRKESFLDQRLTEYRIRIGEEED